MRKLCSEVLAALEGRTLVTAESLTGGGIGSALTAISGSSAVYKGGIISYTNQVKQELLGVPGEILARFGAVSEPVAKAMAEGARRVLRSDVAVSVTGLAGPGGDEYGNPVGTVFIGYCDGEKTLVKHCLFAGSREEVREQTVREALTMVLENQK
ncbi:MAG: CinA family protein [Oscillospiraceae bacterium]|nr:CinA family protein [Oscillospiraceae bacterium]